MNATLLQDSIWRAAGRAADVTGQSCDLYRPRDTTNPLSPANRVLRLSATFLPLGGRTNRPVPSSEPFWEGVFDAAYTRPGDILCRSTDSAIFYIAAQQPLLPVLCVRALRRITITRPSSPSSAGLNLYGGTVATTTLTLAEAWPASILAAGEQGTGLANIQSELPAGAWQVLLPCSLQLTLLTGDILTDDQGRTGVIASIESTDQGARLAVRQAST